jgi:hypothetical protein
MEVMRVRPPAAAQLIAAPETGAGARPKRGLLAGGVEAGLSVEAGLKIAALIDLAQRPARHVRGSKARWVAAITLVNSAGVGPIIYFLRGRCS